VPRKKKTEKPQSLRTILSRSPELQQVSRQLSVLALAQMEQEGRLGVRQREQLRRALSAAGEELGWAATAAHSGDSIGELSKSVLTMSKAGAKAMAKDLAKELADKEVEIPQIVAASDSARKLSEGKKTKYPAEVTYCYTARDGSQGMITKTETLVLNDAAEALSASESIVRNITGREKLAAVMVIALGVKQEQLEAMTRILPDFVKYSQDLLRDVLATLQ